MCIHYGTSPWYPPSLQPPCFSPSRELLYNLWLEWEGQSPGNTQLDLWTNHYVCGRIFTSTCRRGTWCHHFLNIWWSLHCGLVCFSIFPSASLFHICIYINSAVTHPFTFLLPKVYSYHLLYYSLYPFGICLCHKNPFIIIFSQISKCSRKSCMHSTCYHSWQCSLS